MPVNLDKCVVVNGLNVDILMYEVFSIQSSVDDTGGKKIYRSIKSSRNIMYFEDNYRLESVFNVIFFLTLFFSMGKECKYFALKEVGKTIYI